MTKKKESTRILVPNKETSRSNDLEQLSRPNNPRIWRRETLSVKDNVTGANQNNPGRIRIRVAIGAL
jgi:hypothetical protein